MARICRLLITVVFFFYNAQALRKEGKKGKEKEEKAGKKIIHK